MRLPKAYDAGGGQFYLSYYYYGQGNVDLNLNSENAYVVKVKGNIMHISDRTGQNSNGGPGINKQLLIDINDFMISKASPRHLLDLMFEHQGRPF